MLGMNEKTGKFDFQYFRYDLDTFFGEHDFIRCYILPVVGFLIGIPIGLLLSCPVIFLLELVFG